MMSNTNRHDIRRRGLSPLFVLGLIAVCFTQVAAAQQVITTYSSGAPGDAFHNPQYLVFDKAGNLFVSDTGNHRVQRIDKQTKEVSTIAGTGTPGSTGDGGPATQAQLNCPKGLAFDPSGNLYIADFCQNVVRRVAPGADSLITGASDEIITTFAGDGTRDACAPPRGVAATQAPVDSPGSLAVDAGGNVFIVSSDCSDFVLRVDAATGLIDTTSFSTGYIGYNAIVFDNAGNLLLSYFGSITQCSPVGGQLLTGVESCTSVLSGFIQPLPRAVDKTGNLYFTDNLCDGGCDLQVLKATSGPNGFLAVDLYAGNGVVGYTGDGGPPLSASFSGPAGMAIDDAGNVYIADIGNNVIRMVGNPPGPNAPTLTSKPASLTNQSTASFAFVDGDSSVTGFACTLDGVQNACSSPVNYINLADGAHSFSVVAQTSGGTPSSPTSYTWTIDTVAPPVPSISSHPANPSASANASFTFSDAEAGVAFTCSLDAAVTFCSSPAGYTGLADGSHTFAVAAKDAAGNVSASNSFTWSIQTTPPPAPTIDSSPATLSNQSVDTFTFSDVQAGVSFSCRLDAGSFGPCTSPVIYAGLPDGQHTFAVQATDPLSGRSSAATAAAWTKDTTPPKVTINGDPGTVIIPSASKVNFSGSSDVTGYLCSFDGSAFAPCAPPFNQSVATPGNHSFAVEGVDAAGNVSNPDSTTWKVTYCHCPVFGAYTDPALNPVNFQTTSPGGGFHISAVSALGGANVSVIRSDGTVVYTFSVPKGFGAHWEFSPDGAHFFYLLANETNLQLNATPENIVVVDLSNGAGTRELNFSMSVYNSIVQWSPSGAYLLVTSTQYLSPQTEIRLFRVAGVSSAVLVHTGLIATSGSTAGADIASWGFNQNFSGEPESAFLYAWVTGQNNYAWNVVNLATGTQTISQSGTSISGYWQFNPCGNIIALVNQGSLNGEEVDLYSVETGAHIGGTSFPLQSVTLNSTSESETATITNPPQTITVARDPSCDPTTPQGSNQSVAPMAPHSNTSPATVTFSTVTQAGATGVTTSSTGNPPPANLAIGTPPVYYDIATSATYSGPITICINYSGIAFGGAPQLFHYENGAWVDRTSSVDTTHHIVCATVTSLSPFAIFSQPAQAPTITSGASATFLAGVPGSFTITTSGNPTAGLAQDGLLPDGVTLVDNGDGTATLGGTPTAVTTGVYPLTFAAFNGVGPDASQSFSLTVGASPSITSASSVTFLAGQLASFAVTATGFPAPSLSESGGLPSGLIFDPTTGLLSGTPALGTGGTYTLSFAASNTTGSVAQTFTLRINQSPAITSASGATFNLNAAGSLLVTTTGFPTPSLSVSGTLPAGVSFVDNGNGTGTLSGTPTVAGSFPLSFSAANGIGSAAVQSFTLVVSGGPVATITPARVNFGNVPLYTIASAKIILQNTGTASLTISKISLAFGAGTDRDDFYWFSLCGSAVAPGKSCPIYVFYFADDLGTDTATLTINDNAPGPQNVSLVGTAIRR